MKVSICIITCERPKGLLRLLKGINSQKLSASTKCEIEVIVVDNDPNGSGINTIESLQNSFKWLIKYEVEKKRGIPYARNKTINLCSEDSTFVVFIDDDEVPKEDWLEKLIAAQKNFNADVIMGPVIPVYEEHTPQWLKEGGFFNRKVYSEGQRLDIAATNNTLVKTKIFAEMNRSFDVRYALTGGSDTHFFMDLNRRGYRIFWTNTAAVKEYIPSTRANIKWLLLRGFREGNVYARAEKDIYNSKLVTINRGLRAFIKLILHTLGLALQIFSKKSVKIKKTKKIATSIGEIMGLLGKEYDEYKKIHGQ